jgi:hypothetical protein
MAKSKKIQKNESRDIKYVSSGTINEFLKNIREAFEQEIPTEYQSVARLSLEADAHDSWSASGYIQASWTREETDTEYEVRIAQEKKYQDARRLQYEQLKKEFG